MALTRQCFTICYCRRYLFGYSSGNGRRANHAAKRPDDSAQRDYSELRNEAAERLMIASLARQLLEAERRGVRTQVMQRR
jgi:hypothetical protein